MKIILALLLLLTTCIAQPGYAQSKKKPAAKKTTPAKRPAKKATATKKREPFDKKLDFFVERLRKDKFTILKSKHDLPDFVKAQLPGFSDSMLADINEPYQEPGVEPIDSTLPGRKLVFLAQSKEIFVIAYAKGGAKASDHIALLQYKDNVVIDALPRVGCHNCKSIKAVMTFINVDRAKKK